MTFTHDGLEIAFVAGGDIWVMDTELREPKQITHSPEEERWPLFAPDGNSLLFVSDAGGQSDIWQATRANPEQYWWQNDAVRLSKLTDDHEIEQKLQFSPDGKQIAFIRGRGDLCTIDADGKNQRVVLEGFALPEFDWSPDAKWFAVTWMDNDFNRDLYIVSATGGAKPYNVAASGR